MSSYDGKLLTIRLEAKLKDGTAIDLGFGENGRTEFVFGTNAMIRGVEDAISCMRIGDVKKVTVPAARAFGLHDGDLVRDVPMSCIDEPDRRCLVPGECVEVKTPEGNAIATVLHVEDHVVRLDFNHKYAGQTLVCVVELIDEKPSMDTFDDEVHAANCSCGCQRLKRELMPEIYSH